MRTRPDHPDFWRCSTCGHCATDCGRRWKHVKEKHPAVYRRIMGRLKKRVD